MTENNEIVNSEVSEQKQTTPEVKTDAAEAKPKAKRTIRKKAAPAKEKTTAENTADEQKPAKPKAKRTSRKKAAASVEVMPATEAQASTDTLVVNEAPVATEPKEIPASQENTTDVQEKVEPVEVQKKTEAPKAAEPPKTAETPKTAEAPKKEERMSIPPCPTMLIKNIVDLMNAPHRQILLSDQQINALTIEDAQKRFRWMEGTLAWVLNYDVVISDTNIWLELLVGHTSSHSDPRVNARLQFERQLEFISRMTKFRRGRFMMMAETYEEIDRFACVQEPTNYKDADFKDEQTCRNIAARLAKRLILSQQRENRLRIEGIGSESHHASFADPAIIRRTVELFAQGKKVLLLTNDASVGIRSMGMCDDLQRWNNIDDDTWDRVWAPLRPMVMTMEDLRQLDLYTRQYHFLQMAAGKQWMEDVPQYMEKRNVEELELWLEGFRPGDKYKESKMQSQQKPKQEQPKQQKQEQPKQQKQEQSKQKQEQPKQQQKKQPKPQKQEQQKAEPAKQEQNPPQEVKQQPEVKTLQEPQPKVEPDNAEQKPQGPAAVIADANEMPAEEQQPKKKSSRRGRGGRRPKAPVQEA